MSIVTELKKRLDEYQTAEITAGALQDISALRVQSIRRQFDKNREFYEDMRVLYGVIQSQATKGTVPSEKPKRLRQLYVAITSNKRFYGALMRDIVQALAGVMPKAPDATFLIIGKVGWQYFEQMGDTKRARQMVLADDTPTQEEFQALMKYFEQYERIFVFYPKFINTFKQEVALEDITESPAPTEKPEAAQEVDYIFEPEIPALLSFFDTQVREVLFGRVMLEAELARTSARLLRMGEAQERARHLLQAEGVHLRHEVAAVSNMELLETFAGFTRWNRA